MFFYPLKKNHSKSVLLAFIVLAALYFRLFLSGYTLTANEALLYTESAKIANGITPHEYTSSWSPFFLSAWHGWLLPDLRALVHLLFPFLKAQFYLTVIFGILVVISTFRLGARLYNEKIGLLAAFFVAVIPIQSSMSYGLSAEIPLTFFILETFAFLIDGIAKENKRLILISSLFFSCALLSKILAALFVPAIFFFFIINRKMLGKNYLKNAIAYFIIPFIFWLTWTIPNFKRIYSDFPFSLFSFVTKVGTETMKVSLVESNLQFLSFIGFSLLIFSLIFLLYLHRQNDLFLLAIIVFFVGFLNIFKNIMCYYYTIITPFYLIAISKALLSIKPKIIRYSLFLFAGYFAFLCIKSDIINIDLKHSGQNGYNLRTEFDDMIPMLTGSGVLEAISRANEIIAENDKLYLSYDFSYYEVFLLKKKNISYLPDHAYVCGNTICYDKDWLDKVEKMVENNPPNSSLLIVQDGAYYYRVVDKGVWRQTNQAKKLDAAGFSKIYENCYPNDKIIKKSRKYYKHCLTNQWVKNYIYRR